MNTYVEKLNLIHWIAELQDVSVLKQLKALKENISTVPIAEMMSIEKGLDDFQKGKVHSHLQVKKRYEKWL